MTLTPTAASDSPANSERNESNVTPKWWIEQNGKPDGPFTAAYIATLLAQSGLKPTALVCEVGEQKWQELVHCNSLVQALESQSPGCVPPSLPASQGVAKQAGKFVRRFTNPELPWFANLICLYCVLVVPAWFIIGLLFTAGGLGTASDLKVGSPLIGYAITYDVIVFAVDALLATLLVCGGLLMLRLNPKSAAIIKGSIILRLCFLVVELIAVVLWSAIAAVADQAISADSVSTIAGLMFLSLFLVAVTMTAFEGTTLVWLYMNDHRLHARPDEANAN